MLLIKVCGMRDAQNICAVNQLRPDMMGFIMWPDSSRYISSPPNTLPHSIPRVGVFVNATQQYIARKVSDFDLNYVQLHGEEPPEFCSSLHNFIPTVKLIKAFSISENGHFPDTDLYVSSCNLFLFDTFSKDKGGSGKQFSWTILQQYSGPIPFLLSGGIGPDDVQNIRNFKHPLFAGIDVNSCFETAPAVKDSSLLSQFIQQIRSIP